MGLSGYLKWLRGKVGHEMVFMPGVSAIILDDQKRVLLQHARDDGKWHVIGGAMEPTEEAADAVIREVREECGLEVRPVRLVSVQTSPEINYPNGDVVRYVGISFLCEVVGGHLHVADDESLEFRYFAMDELPPLHPTVRARSTCRQWRGCGAVQGGWRKKPSLIPPSPPAVKSLINCLQFNLWQRNSSSSGPGRRHGRRRFMRRGRI